MNYSILPTRRFERELKRLVKKYPSLKEEYKNLINELEKNPQTGILIVNNCRKIRISIASKGKGKSGGARVITYVYFLKEIVYLLTIYDKSEIGTIRDREINDMLVNLDL